MKVLITGATGFLGSYIVDKCIAQGDSVRVLVRKTSNIDYLKKYPSIVCYIITTNNHNSVNVTIDWRNFDKYRKS